MCVVGREIESTLLHTHPFEHAQTFSLADSCGVSVSPAATGHHSLVPCSPCMQVDPMFQRTAASFDECSTTGVFLSTLHCQDYRSELLFPSDMQALSSGEPLELPDLGFIDMTDLEGE